MIFQISQNKFNFFTLQLWYNTTYVFQAAKLLLAPLICENNTEETAVNSTYLFYDTGFSNETCLAEKMRHSETLKHDIVDIWRQVLQV